MISLYALCAHTWCRDLYIWALFIYKSKAIVEVCSAGVWFCSCVEACSLSFALIRLHRGGLEWPWVPGPLPMRTEMCV